MSQHIKNGQFSLIAQVLGDDDLWQTITMTHRGRAYYLRFFLESPLAFVVRLSNTSQRNSENLPPVIVTVLKTEYWTGTEDMTKLVDEFEDPLRKFGYTNFRYITGCEWEKILSDQTTFDHYRILNRPSRHGWKFRVVIPGGRVVYSSGYEIYSDLIFTLAVDNGYLSADVDVLS